MATTIDSRTTRQVSWMLGVTLVTLASWRREQQGPGFLVTGAGGTLLGGWLADRTSRVTTIRLGFALAVPGLLGVVLSPNPPLAFVCVAVAGVAAYLPFSVFVMMGQDYLPNRIGTASGVTVGLAVSVGGLFNPLLGWLADMTSLRFALTVLIALPVIALALTVHLREATTEVTSDLLPG